MSMMMTPPPSPHVASYPFPDSESNFRFYFVAISGADYADVGSLSLLTCPESIFDPNTVAEKFSQMDWSQTHTFHLQHTPLDADGLCQFYYEANETKPFIGTFKASNTSAKEGKNCTLSIKLLTPRGRATRQDLQTLIRSFDAHVQWPWPSTTVTPADPRSAPVTDLTGTGRRLRDLSMDARSGRFYTNTRAPHLLLYTGNIRRLCQATVDATSMPEALAGSETPIDLVVTMHGDLE